MTSSSQLHSQQAGLPKTASWTVLPALKISALKAALLLATTLLAMLLLGYHPYAEDGGIYAAAVQGKLHPDLFPHDRVWVSAHTRFALFVPLVAAFVHVLHASPASVLFFLYCVGLFALLCAAVHLAQTCFPQQLWPWLTVVAVACAAGLPVAGTSLYAVDPYCTARSLTTPLLLFALSLALRRTWLSAALCWIAAAALHPLMAIWGLLPLLLIACLDARHRVRWTLAVTAGVLLSAALLFLLAPAEISAARHAAATRNYWFPAEWHWYEWAGAVAPCVLLGFEASNYPRDSPLRRVFLSTTAASALSVLVALLFARSDEASLSIARLQPLRTLHLVFLAFLVASAAYLQSRLRGSFSNGLALGACIAIAASTLAMQRSLYAHTAHLELQRYPPGNAWETAFLWCRENTPPSALFALDSNYIDQPSEDSHGFRAIALRSALPDRVKDAGVAAVIPSLTPAWQTGVLATSGLNGMTDAERAARLQPLGVTWIVLSSSAPTALPCPYRNGSVQVCRLDGFAAR